MIGNEYDCVSRAYLAISLFAAASAAAPGTIMQYAIVSVTVTSHVIHLPLFYGINIKPSGRLPSVLRRPDGSLISAFERAPDDVVHAVMSRGPTSAASTWQSM